MTTSRHDPQHSSNSVSPDRTDDAQSGTEGKSRPLLLVDDEPLILEALAEYLEGYGFECKTAASGEKAIHSLERESYALVLTDLSMPGMTGQELLRYLARRWPEMPVIVMTARPDLLTNLESIRPGRYDSLVKPFALGRLLSQIRKTLACQTQTLGKGRRERELTDSLEAQVS